MTTSLASRPIFGDPVLLGAIGTEREKHPYVRLLILALLLMFPIIGTAYLPFIGGSSRYLTAVAGPMALLVALMAALRFPEPIARAAANWIMPFAPLLVAVLIISAIHPATTHANPQNRLFWAVAIFITASLTQIRITQIVWSASIAGIIYFSMAAYQYFFTGLVRASGGINEITFGHVAAIMAGISLLGAVTLRDAGPNTRRVWLLAGLLGVATAIMSGSRGTIIPLVLIGIPLSLAARNIGKKAFVATAVVGAMLLIAYFLIPAFSERVVAVQTEIAQYFREPDPPMTSIGIRLELWRIGVSAFLQSPLYGFEYSNIKDLSGTLVELNRFPAPYLEELSHFHNDWITAMVKGGVILLTGQLATLLWLFRRSRANQFLLWLVLYATVAGMTDLVFHSKTSSAFFFALWALVSAAGGIAGPSDHAEELQS